METFNSGTGQGEKAQIFRKVYQVLFALETLLFKEKHRASCVNTQLVRSPTVEIWHLVRDQLDVPFKRSERKCLLDLKGFKISQDSHSQIDRLT